MDRFVELKIRKLRIFTGESTNAVHNTFRMCHTTPWDHRMDFKHTHAHGTFVEHTIHRMRMGDLLKLSALAVCLSFTLVVHKAKQKWRLNCLFTPIHTHLNCSTLYIECDDDDQKPS